MDRSSLLNEYTNESEELNLRKGDAFRSLDEFKSRVKGVKSFWELKEEVERLLINAKLPTVIENKIALIHTGLNGNSNIESEITRLEEILDEYATSVGKKAQEVDEKVADIKEEVAEKAVADLEEAGIEVIGDLENVTETITTEEDVAKLESNVATAVNYVGEYENSNVELSTEDLAGTINLSGDETLQGKIEESIAKDITPTDNYEVNDDYEIVINADLAKEGSMNFVNMAAFAFVAASASYDLENSMGMRISKGKKESNSFEVKFGNYGLPKKNDPLFESKINGILSTFNSSTDYRAFLLDNSPEIAMTLKIVEEHILGREGAFRLAVKKNDKTSDIKMFMDENYEDIYEAFNTNGAETEKTTEGNNLVGVLEKDYGYQLMTLAQTIETLEMNKEQELSTEGKMMQKTLGEYSPGWHNQVAKMDQTLLIVVTLILTIILILGVLFLVQAI